MTKFEQTGFYGKDDLRSENRELALKMVFRDIRQAIQFERMPKQSLSCAVMYPREFVDIVEDILNRWKIKEEEIGTRLSVSIEFPEGVVRNQWFYDASGAPYAKKHDGRPEPVKKKKKKAKKK